MMTLEEKIYSDLAQMNIDILECPLKSNKAVAFEEGYMGVNLHGLTTRERNEVLAHESGHFKSGSFYHAYSPMETKTRVETRAARSSFLRYLPFEDLNAAMRDGICTEWELAEYFELPERYIRKAIDYYVSARGLCFGDPEDQLTMYAK